MTGVIYARYSSDNQREESIEGQLRENNAFAEKNGITIIGTYIDRAFSAKTDNRPEFQRMIKESAKMQYDYVIVWKLDRFSRNRYDSAKYKAILKRTNKKVLSATEAISQGAEGIILESVLEGMAEYYSAELAEKVNRGMMENALKCRYNGGISLPYGYKIDEERHYQIDPITAPIVLEIFTRYVDSETAASIINDLNERGLKTSRGVFFNKNSLRNLINNRNYIGEYHYNKVIIPGGVPAIVPEELFNKAKEKMQANHRAPGRNKAKEKYILTTKLFCGECQSMLVGESGQKETGIYRYYKCASAKRHLCTLKPIRKDLIEEYVIRETQKFISDYETMQKIAKSIMALLNEDNTVIPALEAQCNEIKKSIANLLKAIESGVITKSTKQRLEELETEEERISASIEKEKANAPTLTEEQILFVLDKYRRLDMTVEKNREKLIDDLLGSILVYDNGRVVVTINYRKEPIETTLTEILAEVNSGSDFNCLGSPKQKHTAFVVCFCFTFGRGNRSVA